ncbi:MAG: hypothetical protein CMJ74_07465 [Planctomycetaceae bacterium]|nr:hypothetical protein [Planctomycetaceae bacterium]
MRSAVNTAATSQGTENVEGVSLMSNLGRCSIVFITLILVLAPGGMIQADSVLDKWSPNFATLDTTMWLKYEDIHGYGTADVSNAPGPHIIANSRISSHYESIANPIDLFPAGGSSVSKDFISGRMNFKLDFGSPVLGSTLPDDTFSVDIQGTMSAYDARNGWGHESNAVVQAKAVSEFFIDANHGGGVAGARVGYLLFPKLEFGPWDTVKDIYIIETDPVSGAIASSSFIGPHPEFAVPILGDRSYNVSVQYAALVPFGTDPPYYCPYSYHASYSNPYGGSSAVPEPNSTMLLLLGLMTISSAGFYRRKR